MPKNTGAAGLVFAAGEPVDIPLKFLERLIRNPRDRGILDSMRRGDWLVCSAPEFSRRNAESKLCPKSAAKFEARACWMHYLRRRAHAIAREARGWTLQTAVDVLRWAGPSIELRDALVTENLGLVHKMAQRGPIAQYEDRVAEGSHALIRAVDRFDWTRGVKFSSYACTAINWSFAPDRKGIVLPSDAADVYEVDPGEAAPDTSRADARDTVNSAIRRLPPRDRQIVRKMYGLGGKRRVSPTRIAAECGMKIAAVRDVHDSALDAMRNNIRAGG